MSNIRFARLSESSYVRWLDAAGPQMGAVLYPGANPGQKVDGALDRERLRLTWELARAGGQLRAFFYDMPANDAQNGAATGPDFATFHVWAYRPEHWFFLLYHDFAPAAFVCLEDAGPTGSQRLAHFCTLGTATRPQLVDLGRAFVRWLGAVTPIRQLLGLTPACYRHALAFARDVGFAPLATLDEAVLCRGRHRNAVLTLCSTAA